MPESARKTDPTAPAIGVFDSGVGGLSVLRAIRQQYPAQNLIYFADQAHVPYGSRSLEEVRCFSEEIARFLLEQGAGVVVVACNTASAAALHTLRDVYPQTPFVGMDPAVKPAAEQTHTGLVGVLATPATFQGALYASVVERFANGVVILQNTCPGLVCEIEAGRLDGERTRAILEEALHPMLAQGVDTIVMGCTHYPFVIPLIERIIQAYAGAPAVRVIDPAAAIARQTGRVLAARGLQAQASHRAAARFITTGEPAALQHLLPALWGGAAQVERATWRGGSLTLAG
ncbi:MAG: glutamate racemase [Anaerolineaceae bacterium]|nr:glutamate racemase [Anaerolineaceae bacterium]